MAVGPVCGCGVSDGELAYQAYADAVGGKTHDGRDMPAWGDLGDRIRSGWDSAAEVIRILVRREGEDRG